MNTVFEQAEYYQELFNLMDRDHGLILTISEMDDIISEVEKCKSTIKIDQNVLIQAVTRYGIDAQIKMVREECLELAVEISKFFDRDPSVERHDKMVDEIADVIIMVRQMEFVCGIDHKIQERVDFKINRLKNRLNETNIKRTKTSG